ncbi:hypothetical protein BD289DRAFT_453866 [Coniella lustricola]|uniref:Rhodopsin domain-containing protein n=1 Tax=Coniella lustricola TaxID=2025994 RepID=A0A2T3A5N7_9PEZI|nr:hypothetical protein BD289DRAFT_453866 [Coniella lustricola]
MIQIPLVKPGQIALLTCSIIFGVIPTIAVILRLVARRIAHRKLDAADYLILFAWLMTVALATTCVLETIYGGFGWHRLDVIAQYSEQVIVNYHIITMPLEIFWTLSISVSKMSLLLLYVKVFPLSRLTIVSKMTFVFVGLLAVSGVLTTLLICQPIQRNWYIHTPGHCGSLKAAFGIYGVLNLVTDVMVLALPIPSLVGLKLPALRKCGLVATFAVGFLTCVASVVRLAFLTTMDYLDITYSGVPFILMSVVEPSLAVTLACVPLLRPLLGQRTTRYSATGTREHVASLSPVACDTSHATTMARSTRAKRGRSSAITIPAQVLQYHYEMGLCPKEDVPIDIQELMLATRNDYAYQAEISGGGHESDDSLKARTNSDDFEITPVEGANIFVKQEWSVSNEIKS